MSKLGLAMITVNPVFRNDFSRTFMELGKIGIHDLEFKTFFGYSARELRRAMDVYGMHSLASHERKRDLRDPELLKHMMDYQAELGTKYIVYTLGAVNIPSEINALIDDLNRAGEILAQNGFSLLYHNHAREYEKMPDGQYIMDYILDRVDARFANLELDVLYLNAANRIPVCDYIRSRADRIRIVHLKDGYIDYRRTDKQDDFMCAVATPVGDGIVQIQETVDSVMETGIKWMLIENEEPPVNCFEEVRLDRERILGSYGFREE